MPIALLALAVASFGIGTAEFVMMGLLPEVAADLHVLIPAAGGYISMYALGVVIGAPVLTLLGFRARRKTMLLSLLALFVVGNLLSAFAVSHGTLLAARFVTGLPHGAFYGMSAVVAAGLVPAERRGRAIAQVFLGLTIANVVGVPVGTQLGDAFGWRWAFAAVAVIGVIALAAVAALVPRQPKPTGVSVRGELGAFRRPQVWLSFAVVAFGFAAIFSFFSYIKPVLTDVTGLSAGAVTPMLAVFGAGMTAGTALGGRLADRSPLNTLYAGISALAASLAVFALTAHNPVMASVMVFVIGASAFTAIPSIQARILEQAREAPAMGSASVHSAFNIANSLGAYLGGMVIAAGFGMVSPSWVGVVLALAGLVFAVLSGRLDSRPKRREDVASGAADFELTGV